MKYNLDLHLAIKQKGWTQKEFARIVGDHPTIVSRVVNGWVNLDEKRKAKYAKFLDCQVSEIFD